MPNSYHEIMPKVTGSPSEKCSLVLSTAYCHLNSSGDTKTKVRSEQPSNRGLNPQWMHEPSFHNVQTGPRTNPASHPTVTVTEIGHGGKRQELEYVELHCHFLDSSIINQQIPIWSYFLFLYHKYTDRGLRRCSLPVWPTTLHKRSRVESCTTVRRHKLESIVPRIIIPAPVVNA
jgi:hypothetical protein